MTTTYENVIEQIAQSVFSTMLSLDLVRVDDVPTPDQDSILASVHIAGEWTGSVVLSLSPRVSLHAAAAMLGISADETTLADCRDVASELVNMIGGNLKSMLPGPSFLSLPTIIAGREFAMQVRDAELIDDVVMACESGLLRMRLFSRREK